MLVSVIGLNGETSASTESPAKVISISLSSKATPGVPEILHEFLGFSYEKKMLSWPLFQPDNSSLIALFKNLGPGVLRLGGDSVDVSFFDPQGKGMSLNVVSPPDLERLAGFLKATGWRVIYGINMAHNTPDKAAAEAESAYSACRESIGWFEIGNEPNIYFRNGARGTSKSSWGYSDFLKEWSTFAQAIHSKVPEVALSGPSATGGSSSAGLSGKWALEFGQDERKKIDLLTQHYYWADGSSVTPTETGITASLDLLLNGDAKLGRELQSMANAARKDGIKGGYRMDECNSFYGNGGAPVSRLFGTALWAIDLMFANAAAGTSGINFHGGSEMYLSGLTYTPIAIGKVGDLGSVVGVRPEYYAMFLFSLALPGWLIECSMSPSAQSVSSYALLAEDGSQWVIINNKSVSAVNFKIPSHGPHATVWELTAPSIKSDSGYTFGGAEIMTDGTWSPSPAELSVGGDDTVVAAVSGGSAALIHLEN